MRYLRRRGSRYKAFFAAGCPPATVLACAAAAFEQIHAAAMIVFDLALDQTLPSPRLVHCGRTDAAPDDD